MKIMPVTSPHAIPPQGTPEHVRTAKAIEAFNKGASSYDKPHQQPAAQVVHNQNAISPEEAGAIKASTEEPQEVVPGQTDVPVETPPIEAPAEDPALSRQFAQLARQEKALRLKAQQQDQAIKAREQAIEAREAAAAAKDNQYKSGYIQADRLKADPLSVLAEAGLSYDQLTEQLLNQVPTDPRMQAHIAKLEARIEELSAKSESTEKTYKEQQTQAYQAAVRQIEMDVKSLVNSNPEFETIKHTGSAKDVVDLITETYDKDGVLLTVEEAAQEVENYLMEQALKLTKIEKIKKQMAQGNANSPSNAPGKIAGKSNEQQQQPMKTLTNAASSSRQLSAKERAILAFKGELKS